MMSVGNNNGEEEGFDSSTPSRTEEVGLCTKTTRSIADRHME